MYGVDGNNDTIRKITPLGTNRVTSTIGGMPKRAGFADGTNSAARFGGVNSGDGPAGIAVDGNGNLYVADYGNSTIRMGMPLPVIQIVGRTKGLVTLSWASAFGQWRSHALNISLLQLQENG